MRRGPGRPGEVKEVTAGQMGAAGSVTAGEQTLRASGGQVKNNV